MAFLFTDSFSDLKTYRQIGGDGVQVDWSRVVSAIQRMDNKEAQKTVKSIMRKTGNKIKKPVAEEIKRLYPGGKKYPRNKGRKTGVLRGVQYGPLFKDVKMSVYKNSKGVNVSLFSPKKKQNRWSVLMWLNDGTNERANKRSIYAKSAKSRKKVFLSSNGQNRGRIIPAHFFEQVAEQNLQSAADYSASEFSRMLVAQFNKK
jgi:hypothetical protein